MGADHSPDQTTAGEALEPWSPGALPRGGDSRAEEPSGALRAVQPQLWPCGDRRGNHPGCVQALAVIALPGRALQALSGYPLPRLYHHRGGSEPVLGSHYLAQLARLARGRFVSPGQALCLP
jgi:hypothetical protein